MARLDPEVILKNVALSGWNADSIGRFLVSHGFIVAREQKHSLYVHPDYPELGSLEISRASGDLDRAYVKKAALACMRVKELNAARRAGGGYTGCASRLVAAGA